jgi:hypothetical protein
MNTIYISGPMRGYPNRNADAFSQVEELLYDQFDVVVNPHDLGTPDSQFDPTPIVNGTPEAHAAYLRRDLMILATECNAICLLPGWEESAGARVEAAAAKVMGFRFYEAQQWDGEWRFGRIDAPDTIVVGTASDCSRCGKTLCAWDIERSVTPSAPSRSAGFVQPWADPHDVHYMGA